MASVNKVILVGHLGRDPETRYAPSGDAICNVTLATSESWKDKASGEKKEATEWHRVVFFEKLAEIAGQYLHKGSQVYVEGSLRTRKWTDNNGQERYTTEIRADEMKMLGGKSEDSGESHQQSNQKPAQKQQNYKTPPKQPSAQGGDRNGFDDFDQDIPFANPYRGFIPVIL